MSTRTSTHPHMAYCLPRPGLDEPRIERYTQTVYDQDGITPVRSCQIVRCVECGSATYDGVQRD